MKNLIIMMNAMKRYNHDELLNEESGIQEKLNQDVNVPTFRKLLDMVHNKHCRFIKRK